ncbi:MULTISPECIES: L-tyrosine isonitrile synthase [Serratia]|uniref:Pyoverdine/dityrosine biosynthesis protein n=1 Tax=Serratia ficaria TaxID=61651 RepID=A0A240AX51_SERFI|nr:MULTISPECIES: L-tyrosine isonitrile synthase [Serratia]REF46433.1 2-isocyano-3-(4-hydroxyphenyl)propanoate synthase [Serratia ficaria]CAI0938732.1 Pyoverdine/dityrosine biosynthesis protein [Serratia ficaria]CAI0969628.1 Pyoverdine/dityrosine biosynthesis protein [Serratia ficaria]CAI0978266.1 Pyoverdine/dityrosine biosynthesis protein [Serratia ficaria]CAI0992363.1 Pyoverdine/dityrosine biosynthesis protein [Serratia ficaria]
MDSTPIDKIASKILHELLQYRRRFPGDETPIAEQERQVTQVQLPRIRAFIENDRRIEFVLPAFPTKSPNTHKVIGAMPDMAERLSLIFLNSLCQRIQLYYPPGAHIVICSDGHVFGDLIRVGDDAINRYQRAIENLLHEVGATHLSLFNLGDVEGLAEHTDDCDLLRQLLVSGYAEPEETIKQRLMQDEQGLMLYRAITRFLYEDSQLPGYSGSNAALQKDAKRRACGVIQRSWAWGNLLAQHFPAAIRLSIHPQPADSLKMGIHMMPTKDDWLTPWHGVAANVNGQFVLMKRKDAQQLAGELVEIRGEPSHYRIEQP